jgi:hypothetical protein
MSCKQQSAASSGFALLLALVWARAVGSDEARTGILQRGLHAGQSGSNIV